jgi:two-component system, chemotaxis family, protein-glutamate methylesterase/glutaminase
VASKPIIVVVGASAGGITSLEQFVAGLTADIAAAIFVVLHIRPDAVSNLAQILSAKGPLPAVYPRDGAHIRPGQIYVASPDHHLLIEGTHIGVKKGPKENRFRPSVDALFRSAAYCQGRRVIGVVLSGALDDGTSGLWTIKRFGGTTIVQDPTEASVDSMPLSAIQQVDIDYTLRATQIGPLISRLVSEEARDAPAEVPQNLAERVRIEIEVAASTNAFKRGIMNHGELTVLTCPECHGALVKLTEGSLVRYRCHTGHGYTASALLAGITEAVGSSLWEVTRALEECVMLLDEMAEQLVNTNQAADAERFRRKARDTEKRARALQELTIKHEHLSQDALRGREDAFPKMPGGE